MASSRNESEKENIHRTRIPLPKEPLPALPIHLLRNVEENKKTQVHDHITQRCPLRTLNSQIIPKAGPSKVIPHKPTNPMSIDMRNVTVRQRRQDLDWHYTVFKDIRVDKEASVISISDDERHLDDNESQQKFVEKRKKSTLGEALSGVTPLKACLEPSRIKNIKRSLKRPHSRELQGLSPVVAKQDQNEKTEKVKRRLQFNESIYEILRTPDFWKRSYMRCLDRDYTSDVFDYLLAVEIKPLGVHRTSNITRACVINWLMKVNGADGNPAIVQSACWYLDSILGTGRVQPEKLQLVATACFWIAQKLNGPGMAASRLVRCSNKAFTAERLSAAEKAVLIRLNFPRQPIVAQDYITYLSWWCGTHNSGEIELAASFLCMCGLMVDRVLCEEYPSVIAIAAVRNALLLLNMRSLIPRLQMCRVFKAAEKKATDLPFTCSILRRAVRTVAASIYEYKAPLEHFSIHPFCIAQRIVNAANEFAILDARNTDRI